MCRCWRWHQAQTCLRIVSLKVSLCEVTATAHDNQRLWSRWGQPRLRHAQELGEHRREVDEYPTKACTGPGRPARWLTWCGLCLCQWNELVKPIRAAM
jgi:hypothetical protein